MDIGTQIGPYQVNGLIGRGGMAEVYKAWNVDLHREEALKVLPPQMTFDPSFVERFLKEARTAASLRHAHIATIYMVSPVTESRPYFAMELVQGGDLAGLLHRQGSLPLGSALPLLRQIAGALDYAHRQGVVHRDVKPANILLEDDGHGGWNVKVVDFGIARAQEAGDGARLTKTGMIVGTPEYMSPEQGGSGEKVDHRSDQYSLGAVAYEMLCGRPPFAVGPDGTAMTVIMSHIRDTPHAPVDYVPGLIPSANNAVLRALSKKPEDRFASCAEFVAALESRAGVENPAASVPQPPLQRRPARVVPLLIGGAFILGAGLIGFGINRSGSRQPVRSPSTSVPAYSDTPTQPQAEPTKLSIADKPIPTRPKIGEQVIASFLTKWLSSQNGRQVETYASLYAPDFIGIKRTPNGRQTTYHLSAWLKDRGRMLTSADDLNVTISNQVINIRPEGAKITFNQYFKTRKYSDWGPKVLEVRSMPNGLQIYREEMSASYPLK